MGVPQGSGYPLYLFWFYRKPKKDAAPIPNAKTSDMIKYSDFLLHSSATKLKNRKI